jgi:ubiquitin carboxyl-terminal hydrolase 7
MQQELINFNNSLIIIMQEIKQGMIEPMKAKSTLSQAELQDGDVVTVQRVISDKE